MAVTTRNILSLVNSFLKFDNYDVLCVMNFKTSIRYRKEKNPNSAYPSEANASRFQALCVVWGWSASTGGRPSCKTCEPASCSNAG